MSERLHRVSPPDLVVRSSGDGRTIVGIAVPFDTPTEIRDGSGAYTEAFVRGAFARTLAERGSKVKVLASHDRARLPIGKATLLREDLAGLYAELRISDTQAGDEVLQLVHDGALDSLSVGFSPVRDRQRGGIVERVEVRLHEISPVAFPAYASAEIVGVRHDQPHPIPVELARARLAVLNEKVTR